MAEDPLKQLLEVLNNMQELQTKLIRLLNQKGVFTDEETEQNFGKMGLHTQPRGRKSN